MRQTGHLFAFTVSNIIPYLARRAQMALVFEEIDADTLTDMPFIGH